MFVLLALPVTVVFLAGDGRAANDDTVTLVNQSGETLWIGSGVNADGSRALTGLPVLSDGQSVTINIPDGDGPGYWRGRIFARQHCGGDPGAFHCVVGDCGAFADHCEHGAEPVSLAEFNFDHGNGGAPFYNVSYVDAMSVPITMTPEGADPNQNAGSCLVDCSGRQMIDACPAENAQSDQGTRVVCVNPNRDAESGYTHALGAFGPRAYLWSTQDRVPGNQTVFACAGCTHFTVVFHGGGGVGSRQPAQPQDNSRLAAPAPNGGNPGVHSFRGFAGKCIDVPGGLSNDGAQLQLWDCNGTDAQLFTDGPNGSQVVLGKCMDVAWAAKDAGAKVQLAWCNGGPAQVWVRDGASLRNPNSGKCVDVANWNPNNGAPLIIWDCHGGANQAWDPVS